MKATVAQQQALLSLHDVDANLARLAAQLRNLPIRAEITATEEERTRNAAQRSEHSAQLAGLEAQSADLALQVEKISAVIADKQAKLQAGVGMDSRELLALQGEINGWKDKADTLGEDEFTLMVQIEELEAVGAHLRTDAEALDARLAMQRQQLEQEAEQIEALRAKTLAERQVVADLLSSDLLRAYDQGVRATGRGVIGVFGNGSTTSGDMLSAVEVSQLKAADEDEIQISDEYECLLVLMR